MRAAAFPRIRTLLAVLALFAGILAQAAFAAVPLQRYARHEMHMGVDFEVVLYAPDERQATRAIDAAMARIASLDKALSDYALDSELSKLSATSAVTNAQAEPVAFPAVKLSDDLWTVLAFSQQLSERSDGAFDVTIGPLTKLWRRARRQKTLPERELFDPAKAAVGHEFLQLDQSAQTARLLKPNMRLDLGGIAKGYAADEALATVRKHGMSRALVRASGDIAAGDPPPGEVGWLVGVAPLDPDEPPSRFVRLANRAVSTSGDSRQHLEIDGKRYSHIVDPRTGLGVVGRSSVTVIAPRGMAADSLATAASILGPDKALDLIARYQGTALLMVSEDAEGRLRTVASENLAELEAAPPQE